MRRAAAAAALLLAAAAAAGPPNETLRGNVDAVLAHLRELDAVAGRSGGSRSIASGYNGSAEYVVSALRSRAPALAVSTQHFVVPVWTELAPPQLSLIGAEPAIPLSRCITRTGWQHYPAGCDYSGARYGGNGTFDVLAHVSHVPAPCTEAGWAAFPAGHAALIEVTPECEYYTMGMLAEGAGAAAVLIASAHDTAGLPGSRFYDSATWEPGTPLVQVPCVGVTAAVGALLRQRVADARTHARALESVRVIVSARTSIEHTYNVFADTADGDASEVLMLGAHLDSVPDGPGINDNGSGSALVLQIALDLALRRRRRGPRVRFAWWGAEEIGLMGSRHYVDDLVAHHPAELARIQAYLNFDMEAGPNYIRMVYDGATAPEPAREGSVALQRLFEGHWRAEGLSFGLTPMGGGSDFLPFILAGVPASGLATGAGGVKSHDERAAHGGLANAPLDPCYHAPCDSIDNVSPRCLAECDGAVRGVLRALIDGAAPALPRRPPPPPGGAERYAAARRGASRGFQMSCDAHDDDAPTTLRAARREEL